MANPNYKRNISIVKSLCKKELAVLKKNCFTTYQVVNSLIDLESATISQIKALLNISNIRLFMADIHGNKLNEFSLTNENEAIWNSLPNGLFLVIFDTDKQQCYIS